MHRLVQVTDVAQVPGQLCHPLLSLSPQLSHERGVPLSRCLLGSKSGSFYPNSPFKRSPVTVYSSGLNWGGEDCTSQGTLSNVWGHLSGFYNWEWTSLCLQWVEPRDAAKHPVGTRQHLPHSADSSGPRGLPLRLQNPELHSTSALSFPYCTLRSSTVPGVGNCIHSTLIH